MYDLGNTYFEMFDNGMIYRIRHWVQGHFSGTDIIGTYRIVTRYEVIKNNLTEHFTSHRTKGFTLRQNEYLIEVKD